MFDCFEKGKISAQSLWSKNDIERQKKLNILIQKIKESLQENEIKEPLVINRLVYECGLDRLSQKELSWIEEQLEGDNND